MIRKRLYVLFILLILLFLFNMIFTRVSYFTHLKNQREIANQAYIQHHWRMLEQQHEDIPASVDLNKIHALLSKQKIISVQQLDAITPTIEQHEVIFETSFLQLLQLLTALNVPITSLEVDHRGKELLVKLSLLSY